MKSETQTNGKLGIATILNNTSRFSSNLGGMCEYYNFNHSAEFASCYFLICAYVYTYHPFLRSIGFANLTKEVKIYKNSSSLVYFRIHIQGHKKSTKGNKRENHLLQFIFLLFLEITSYKFYLRKRENTTEVASPII